MQLRWHHRVNEALGRFFRAAGQRRPRLSLVLLTLLWLLPGNAHLPLVDRDEPRFAYATQEMVDSGSSWVPTFNTEYRFDKPPLVYWWMRLHYAVLGFNEFSARLHSVVATVFCILLLHGFASRLYGPRAGFLSAFGFLTLLQVFLHGRLCVADMPMMVFLLAAQWASWELLQKSSWRWAAVFWASLALGFTTKWLVPVAAVGVPLGVYFLLRRRWPWSAIPGFKPLSGLLLAGLIIAAWAVPAWLATNGEFFKIGLGEHFFQRGVAAFNSRGYHPFFYLFTSFISLLPWLGLVGALVASLKTNFGDKEKFLVSWLIGIYVLFSLARTQLPHYVLPAFPSLLILLGALTQLRLPRARWASRVYWGANYLWWAVLGLVALVVLFVPASAELFRVKLSVLALLLAFASLTLLGLGVARRAWGLSALGFVAVPIFFALSAAGLQGLLPSQRVAQIFNQAHRPELLVASGYQEPSLVSYTRQPWLMQGDYSAAREAYQKAPSAAFVVLAEEFTLESLPALLLKGPLLPQRDQQKMLLTHPPQGGRRFHFQGVHLGRFSWVRGELYLKP